MAYRPSYAESVTKHELSKIRDNPLDPVQLLFDNAGNLIVISIHGQGHGVQLQTGLAG